MRFNHVEILTDDDPMLKQVSEPVTVFDEGLQQLVGTMIASMHHRSGVGLAAVQIGQLKRVVIVRENDYCLVMINPVFVRKGNRFVTEREGCLSIRPSKWREVSRPAKCEVKFQDLLGNEHILNMSGPMARRTQHEMDHLDGILITDLPPAGAKPTRQ